MYRLSNIPRMGDTNVEIRCIVDGCDIKIVAVDKRDRDDVFKQLNMGTLMIGDHMFAMPEALRQMVGNALVTVIDHAYKAGYREAQADIRRALGA